MIFGDISEQLLVNSVDFRCPMVLLISYACPHLFEMHAGTLLVSNKVLVSLQRKRVANGRDVCKAPG